MDDPTSVLHTLVQQQQQQEEQEQTLTATALQIQNQVQEKENQFSQEQQLQQELEQNNQEQHEVPQSSNNSGHEMHLDVTISKDGETVQIPPNDDETSEQLLLHRATSELLEQNRHLIDESGSVAQILVEDQENHTGSGTRISNNNASGSIIASTSFFFKSKKSITSLETLDSAMASAVAAASSSINTSTTPSPSTSSPVSASAATIAAISKSVPSSSSSASVSHPSYNRFEKCPTIIKWPANDWETWLEKERSSCRWNMIRHRHRDKQTFARGPTASEWIREFQCDHAGQYRDRKNPNIDPSKKRKRSGSIKCNCPAFIKMRKQFQEDEVVIEYFWRHEGHIPDVMEDIKAQRLPQDLKAWIKRRVNEGHDWKTVKHMMTNDSPLLKELHPTTKDNIRILLQSSYAQYANTARQFKSKRDSRSPSSQLSDAGKETNSEHRFGAREGLHSSSKSSQKQASSSTQHQKDTVGTQPTWQIVSLNLSNDSIQSNHSNRDNQTLAVHNLPSSSSADARAVNEELKRQALALGDVSFNAETMTRLIRDRVAVNEANDSQKAADVQGVSDAQRVADVQALAALALARAGVTNVISPPETSTTPINQDSTNSTSSNGQNSLFSNTLQETVESSLQTGNALVSNIEKEERTLSEGEQQQKSSQEPQQPVRQPRDMMLEMLRAIAELHEQMETTEEYGTQEDATHIIESFALPIRLMKEALERRSGNH